MLQLLCQRAASGVLFVWARSCYAPCRALIGEQGAIELLFGAMQAHPTDPKLVAACCQALCNLSYGAVTCLSRLPAYPHADDMQYV